MAGTHSLWSPSSAKAWRPSKGCAGYVVMNDGAPNKASIYSAEGTCYHGRTETVIRDGGQVADFVGQQFESDGFKFTITEELADYAQAYVDRIRARANAGCIVMVEIKTDTSEVLGIPGQTGTVDCRVFDIANETLEIIDLKFGAGVKVYVCEPEDGRELWERVNDQAGTYGVAEWYRTLYMCNWKFLKLVIDQPRLGGYSEVTLSREEVESFASALGADARKSLGIYERFREDATGLYPYLTPSLDACRWCARAGSCQARRDSILRQFPTREQTRNMVEIPVPAKNLPTMSGAELAYCLDRKEELQSWIRAVDAEAIQRAETKSADAPPGWRLVEGRKGDRSANPDDIVRRAREAMQAAAPEGIPAAPLPAELYTTPQLKSVAQLEGACKKLGAVGKAIWKAITGDEAKGIPSLITQAPGRPTLVRDFDARPDLAPQAVAFELRPIGEEFKQDAAAGLM